MTLPICIMHFFYSFILRIIIWLICCYWIITQGLKILFYRNIIDMEDFFDFLFTDLQKSLSIIWTISCNYMFIYILLVKFDISLIWYSISNIFWYVYPILWEEKVDLIDFYVSTKFCVVYWWMFTVMMNRIYLPHYIHVTSKFSFAYLHGIFLIQLCKICACINYYGFWSNRGLV